ncbi:MAG TPA: ATP-binding protein, partial [Acidobacteriaceae bacterium]|nr:ATP-binding protein [Acidobacteriaceae bacterium]
EIRTASIGLLSPTRSFLKEVLGETKTARHSNQQDPGFSLFIRGVGETADELRDVAAEILASYVLRAVLKIDGQRLSLDVYRRPAQDDESRKPELTIREAFKNEIGPVTAEIRFYPRRKGSFSGLPVDGRRALSWVSRNSGVAVYDRAFRVLPYGVRGDDWLRTAADTARRHRVPRSGLAEKHFPMSQAEQASTELNYMLRLPHPQQLIGAVFVEGARGRTGHATRGLIAAADREGFLDNEAYQQLWDVVRGAVEAIAYVDRRLQKQQEDADRRAAIRRLRAETQQAIKEIQANPRLKPQDRQRLIDRFTRTQADAEAHEAAARRRELQLETLSLLGVVAGFMTHEFGVALDALLKSQKRVAALAPRIPELEQEADALARHIATLNEFASYSRAYIGASADAPAARYSARPRLQQVARVFGAYAVERGITVDIEVSKDVLAPPVPVALYNGVALNLYTNALKAVSALAGDGDRRITFRAWNEGTTHILLVLDTGVGIPTTMRERIFDPLISTTMQNSDPLGSGLGLGLTLVRRAVESFRGRATVVDPPPGFTTAVEVRLPLPRED